MSKPDDLSKPLVALDHDSTLVCVIEMSGSSWLVAATVPGVDRRPLQKLPVDPARLLAQVERGRQEAVRAGRTITRTVVAYESGRDGFWLARLLRGHGVEVYVIHASSVGVSRERRRAKARHRDADARAARLAARRAGALPDGGDPDGRAGGRTATGARGRGAGCRAHPIDQHDQGGVGAVGHPGVQAGPEEGCGAPGGPAHGRGRAAAAEYAGPATPAAEAAHPDQRSDQSHRTGRRPGDRTRSDRAERDGPDAGPDQGHRPRCWSTRCCRATYATGA